ncbi:hypothetical protein BRPE64_ACDS27940 [Caballeronia insecticola]|uniref:Uncharacterized protein n=1 Tax=Caballeronia insecticola TaxID=758793 RepID=R4WJB7_9BURK|nr:hypothetical protein BRPE64_ACDS27940 [Caballeronia insecticola]
MNIGMKKNAVASMPPRSLGRALPPDTPVSYTPASMLINVARS